MRTSWQIFTRDLRRLFKSPRVYTVIVGVLVIPSLYAWFNINAFWDPYSNTDNIRVAVVNEDTGAATGAADTPHLNVGDQITQQLADNDKIGWEFPEPEAAEDGLLRGDYFAAIHIPADFSADLLSLAKGDFTPPSLEYFANEKTNGIAPSITDASATAMNSTITATFKKEVAHAAVEQLRDSGVDIRGKFDSARQDAGGALGQVAEQLDTAGDDVEAISTRVEGSRPVVSSASGTIDSVDEVLAELDDTLSEVTDLTETLQDTVAEFSGAASTALIESTNALQTGAGAADSSIAQATDVLRSAQDRARVAVDDVEGIVSQSENALARLEGLSGAAPLPPKVQSDVDGVLGSLRERTDASRDIISGLSDVDRTATNALDTLDGLGDELDHAATSASDSAKNASGELATSLPQITSTLNQLSSSVGSVQQALNSQRALNGQTQTLLSGVDGQLTATQGVVDQIGADLHHYADNVRATASDVAALLSTGDSETLNTVVALDPDSVSEYLSSPVTIAQHSVYPTENYGSAMAALFTNLSLWIGAFVLTIIYRVEADTEGFSRVSLGQGYLGRFLLFALMAVLQAIVVITGNLLFGVQAESIPALYATAIISSVCYTAIVYALVSAIGHIGRGLAIFLVAIQIPGSSGLYPIELLPGFFRAIYPFLPFRFGIGAMREATAGFYGHHFLGFTAGLVAISLIAFAAGWLFRTVCSHFNLLFNAQLQRSGIVRGENVEITGSPYRLSDVLAAIGDRSEYRDTVRARTQFIRHNYRALITAGIVFGVVGAAVITGLAAFAHTDKTVMLAVAACWLLIVIVYLGVVEYLRQAAADAEQVSQLDNAQLRDAIIHRHDSEAPVTEAARAHNHAEEAGR